MRFKTFLSTCAVSVLAGCALVAPDAPEFPLGPSCSMVWNGSLEASYAYCVDLGQNGKVERVPAEEVFKRKYIGTPPEYFGKIMEWKGDMEDYAKFHCNGG